VAARIAWHLAEARRLEQQQRQELVTLIATTIGDQVVFSAKELFEHRVVSPALAAALEDAGITSVRKLGKKLRQLGLLRVGVEHNRALWVVA
jgi:hypothetical protein